MTLCPIALVASCAKCPAFKVCPLKGVIGDHVEAPPPAAPTPAARSKSRRKGASKR